MVDPVSFSPAGGIRGATKPVAAPARPAQTPGTEDAVNTPSLPELLSAAQALARQAPPVDFARVAEIRRAISDRSYSIDPQAIAVALISFGRRADG